MIYLAYIVLFIFVSFFLDSVIINIFNNVQFLGLTSFFELFSIFNILIVLFVFTGIVFYIVKPSFKSLKSLYTGLLLTFLVVGFLKMIIARPRPFEGFESAFYSFPSGHSAIAFASIPAFKDFPKPLFYFVIVFAVFVAVSRLYLQVHYFSDVVFGSIIGYSIGVLGGFLNE